MTLPEPRASRAWRGLPPDPVPAHPPARSARRPVLARLRPWQRGRAAGRPAGARPAAADPARPASGRTATGSSATRTATRPGPATSRRRARAELSLSWPTTIPIRATRLAPGELRDQAILATSQHVFPGNIVYRLARRHVRAVGTYFLIEIALPGDEARRHGAAARPSRAKHSTRGLLGRRLRAFRQSDRRLVAARSVLGTARIRAAEAPRSPSTVARVSAMESGRRRRRHVRHSTGTACNAGPRGRHSHPHRRAAHRFVARSGGRGTAPPRRTRRTPRRKEARLVTQINLTVNGQRGRWRWSPDGCSPRCCARTST